MTTLKELREEKGRSQEKLGQLAGVAGTTIGNIEKGTYTYHLDRTVQKVASALGVGAADIDELRDIPNRPGDLCNCGCGFRIGEDGRVERICRRCGLKRSIGLGLRHSPYCVGCTHVPSNPANPEALKVILDACCRLGITRTEACLRARISPTSLFEWITPGARSQTASPWKGLHRYWKLLNYWMV